MKQECKDCNKSLDDCTCIEDTIDMKQTAIEWLEEQIEKRYGLTPTSILLFRDAKEMEKQQQGYSVEDLECAWNSSDQNMRFQFSSSAYKGITFKQWLEKFKQEK
jgi:hypothetical protein